jgi:hypothetical protein
MTVNKLPHLHAMSPSRRRLSAETFAAPKKQAQPSLVQLFVLSAGLAPAAHVSAADDSWDD